MPRTIDPYLCDISLASNIDALVWSSELYLKIIELYPDEVIVSRYYNYMQQFKLDSLETFFKEIITGDIDINAIKTIDMDTTIEIDSANLKAFSSQFKLFWLEKFWAQHQSVKTEILQALGEENEFYINFSDSIGSLTFLEFVKTNSTLSWLDAEHQDQDIEYTIPGVTFSKLSYNTRIINTYLSKVTNYNLKSNTSNLIDDQKYSPLESHGTNYVTDSIHYDRIISIIDELKKTIQASLGELYDVLSFIKLSDNTQYINPLIIDLDIEGVKTDITILQNVLKSSPSSMTNSVILSNQ